jgi:hypothetical protein
MKVSINDQGVPWVGPDAVADKRNIYLHDLVLGFVAHVEGRPTSAEWQSLRKKLHVRHLKDLEVLPEGCTAIHYFTEGDMSFLLTSSRDMLEEWVDSLLFTEFPNLASTSEMLGLTRTPVAGWILNSSEGKGVQVESIEVSTAKSGKPTATLRGRWGKDPASLAEGIGLLEPNGSFEQFVPLYQ